MLAALLACETVAQEDFGAAALEAPGGLLKAGDDWAGFVNRVLGSARQKKPSTRLYLRLVFGCIKDDFCKQILNTR